MTKQLRAGVIGLGVGEAHIHGYKDAGIEVVALCDLDHVKLHEVAEKHPDVSKLYGSSEELLSDPSINIVSIASFDQFHCEQIIGGLEGGKHLFVEKPLCLSRDEGRRIRQVMTRYPQLRVSSNLILRHSPRFKAVREMVLHGELGNIYHIEGDYLYGRLEKILHGWRGQTPGYTVTLGGGVHIIDLLLWLVRERVTEVRAIGSRLATKGSQVKFPDTVTALLTFANGMTGKVGANFPCVHPHFHKISVYGTEGTFHNAVDGGRVFKERDAADYTTMKESHLPSGKHLLLSEFVKEIRGESAASVDIDDVFAALSVCFAIDDSVRTGNTVHVDYL